MDGQIELGVYRRLDNRTEGLSDDSPRAVELHNRRRAALHDVLDDPDAPQVLSWGDTDDTRPHEYVELAVAIAELTEKALKYVIVPGLRFVAEKLVERRVDEETTQVVKWFIAKFRPKQEVHEILDFNIKLPDGTLIQVDPPDRLAEIRISFADGAVSSVAYRTIAED